MSWYWILLIIIVLGLITYLVVSRLVKGEPLLGAKEPLYYDSLESQFVDIESFKLHYYQAGKGPHLVLLHGIGASTFTWRLLFPLLAQHYTVTALDLPGFGKSSKDPRFSYGLDEQAKRLELFLSELGIHQARLVGSSMGGAIALWMAKKNPDRFFEVIALSPATNKALVPLRIAQAYKASKFLSWSLNRSTMKMIYSKVVARKELATPQTIERYLEPFLDKKQSIPTFLKATELLRDPRLPKELNGIQSRILILYGRRDEVIAAKYMEELQKVLPHAKFIEHGEAGHHIMEDEPQWTYQTIIAFFNEHKDL